MWFCGLHVEWSRWQLHLPKSTVVLISLISLSLSLSTLFRNAPSQAYNFTALIPEMSSVSSFTRASVAAISPFRIDEEAFMSRPPTGKRRIMAIKPPIAESLCIRSWKEEKHTQTSSKHKSSQSDEGFENKIMGDLSQGIIPMTENRSPSAPGESKHWQSCYKGQWTMLYKT